MNGLTEAGREAVRDSAARYGVSEQAAEAMLHAVIRGNGTMAQFNIPELGGSGQWLAGGMTMVGDMFNHGLQATVSGLASDLSQAMASARLVEAPRAGAMGGFGGYSTWPEELGQPTSTGGQNDISYAVFPSSRRLAIRYGGRLHLFDTGDHRIGGVSQSQSGSGLSTLSFQSQYGTMSVVELPRAEDEERPAEPQAVEPQTVDPEEVTAEEVVASSPEPEAAPEPEIAPVHAHEPVSAPTQPAPAPQAALSGDIDSILNTIERLASLRDKGALTEAEFDAKKAELLARI
ncbi:SHOCT domain-containing protein [Minwuia sp.]|uniref:SHOCT domain-containing protein n=1 Tax=Minwuia sp. TaxID=2493630 RepID=UPI003A8E1990